MASMRDIKRRKSSIQSTQQITKAMKLVATVKLQRTRKNAEKAKPYFEYMYHTIHSVLGKTENVNHPFLNDNSSDRKTVIMITSNRGLAGGYDGNISKLVINAGFPLDKLDVVALGKKGRDMMQRHGATIVFSDEEVIETPYYEDARKIADFVLDRFMSGEAGEIYIAYTAFVNTVVHEPKLIKLLPLEEADEVDESKEGAEAIMNFEPEEEEAIDLIIPKYISSIIYGAIVEAAASENGARMQAMDSATTNAEDMISKLSLQYNRARQGAITQELTEIIAGAEATS